MERATGQQASAIGAEKFYARVDRLLLNLPRRERPVARRLVVTAYAVAASDSTGAFPTVRTATMRLAGETFESVEESGLFPGVDSAEVDRWAGIVASDVFAGRRRVPSSVRELADAMRSPSSPSEPETRRRRTSDFVASANMVEGLRAMRDEIRAAGLPEVGFETLTCSLRTGEINGAGRSNAGRKPWYAPRAALLDWAKTRSGGAVERSGG